MGENEFRQWCIVELMGHVRLAGLVTEEQRFGATVGRVDIPQGDTSITQYFGGASIYRVTPTTEEIARQIASRTSTSPPVGLLGFSPSSVHVPPFEKDQDEENEEEDEEVPME